MDIILAQSQGWMTLPVDVTVGVSSYFYWLCTVVVLFYYGCLMVSSFLQCCCRRWRQRDYETNQKSANDQLFYADRSKLSTNSQSPYTINEFRDTQKLRAVPEAELNPVSPTISELRPVPFLYEQAMDDDTENDESHIVQNYYAQNDPSAVQYHPKHSQEILVLPAPTVTTINMAAERVTDDLTWEKIDSTSTPHDENDDSSLKSINNPSTSPTAAQMIIDNPALLLSQNIKYVEQPNIYLHRPVIPFKSSSRKNKVGVRFYETSNEDTNDNYSSIISEMSGSDSESIYQTIPIFTRKQPLIPLMEDKDAYKIEIKDMTRLQNARKARQTNPLVRMSEEDEQETATETSQISSRHIHKQVQGV